MQSVQTPYWTSISPTDQTWCADPPLRAARPAPVRCVGGSLVSLGTAYVLAEAGVAVEVDLAEESPHAALPVWWGGACPNLAGRSRSAAWQALAIAGRDLFPKLTVRPGFDFGWKVTGAWSLTMDAATTPQAEMRAGLEQGLSVYAVDPEQFAIAEPHLQVTGPGGLQCPSEGIFNPVALAACYSKQLGQKDALVHGAPPAGTGTDHPGATCGWNALEVRQSPATDHHWQVGLYWTAPLPPLLARPVFAEGIWQQLRTGELLWAHTFPTTPEATLAAQLEQARTLAEARLQLPDEVQFNGSATAAVAGPEPADPQVLWHSAQQTLTVIIDPRDVPDLCVGLSFLLAEWWRSGNCPELLQPFVIKQE